MAQSNVFDICKLCLQHRRLCKSHYIGKAIHQLCCDSSGNQVVMTPELIVQTPRQLWQHLLCSDCEQKINRRGEIPTLKLINGRNGFPLLERMKDFPKIGRDGDATIYSGSEMGIDTDALAFFALGLIWKGSATVWKSIKGQTTSVYLGAHKEPIRQYLAGETAFPLNVHVIATVCEDFGSQGGVLSPWNVPVDLTGAGYIQIEFLIRGLWFRIIAGSGGLRRPETLCCVRSKKQVIFRRNCEDLLLQSRDHFYSTAKIILKGQ